jgi:hypothetical protein
MLWLWILGAIAVLFALFCLLPLGILVSIEESASAWVTIGPFRIQAAPTKQKKKQKAEKKKKERKEPDTILDRLKKLPKPTLEDLKSAYQALWPPMKRALKRLRRGIRIHPLSLSVVLAGKEDPAKAAVSYGYANAAVWTVMPVLEQLLVIPDPGIHLGIDFEREKPEIRGQIGLSVRIGTLLALGFQIGIPVFKWLLRYRNGHRNSAEKAQKNKRPADTAA